jgi:GNAT superfamily N-acetyltransferase
VTIEVETRIADAPVLAGLRSRLCEILVDCVARGASVHFLAPLDPADADAFWQRVERAVAEDRCRVLVAATADGTVAGTVQLLLDTPPNQRHRAEVAKLLVHSDARRRGIGETLMRELERVAREEHRWLLTLDTVSGGDAARLYERLGWSLAGVFPRYALDPFGELTDASLYWKELERE